MISEEEAKSESEQETWHSKLKEEEMVVFHHLVRERERETPSSKTKTTRPNCVCPMKLLSIKREKKGHFIINGNKGVRKVRLLCNIPLVLFCDL
jgi:hypothetical protein